MNRRSFFLTALVGIFAWFKPRDVVKAISTGMVWKFRPGGFYREDKKNIKIGDMILVNPEVEPTLMRVTEVSNPHWGLMGVEVLYLKDDGMFPQRQRCKFGSSYIAVVSLLLSLSLACASMAGEGELSQSERAARARWEWAKAAAKANQNWAKPQAKSDEPWALICVGVEKPLYHIDGLGLWEKPRSAESRRDYDMDVGCLLMQKVNGEWVGRGRCDGGVPSAKEIMQIMAGGVRSAIPLPPPSVPSASPATFYDPWQPVSAGPRNVGPWVRDATPAPIQRVRGGAFSDCPTRT